MGKRNNHEKSFTQMPTSMDRSATRVIEKQAWEAICQAAPGTQIWYTFKTNQSEECVESCLTHWFGPVVKLERVDKVKGLLGFFDFDGFKNKY